jgi:RNA polymerase sigma-70 factor (ECF subfamily)
MMPLEVELKALMLASLDGNAASHSALDRLSRRLRAYYNAKLVAAGRGIAEAEDLLQGSHLGDPPQAAYL